MAQTGIIAAGVWKHLRILANIRWTDITASTTSSHIYIDWYVESVEWGFDDDQVINFKGSLSGAWSYHFPYKGSASSYQLFLGTYDVGTFATSYSGGPTFTFAAEITGIYAGAGSGTNPNFSWTFTLPARPASAPGAPGVPVLSPNGATEATFTWAAAVANGSPITGYRLQVSSSASFATTLYSVLAAGTSRAVASLTRYTDYYARVRAESAAGSSAWSPTLSFKTLPTGPGAITQLTATPVSSTQGYIEWAPPADNGGLAITSYQVQVATSSGFGAGTIVHDTTGVGQTRAVSDLPVASLLYARVRGISAAGPGSWGIVASFATLSGTWAMVGGLFIPLRMWAKISGVQRTFVPWKKIDGEFLP